jgi:hypothetical protein
MNKKIKLKNSLDIVVKLFRYNMKIIFANKFIYFLLASVGFFVFLVTISLFNNDNPTESLVYYFLLFPGILLVFYPTTFGIQNDADSRMLEILFGIPNYRYKVWLVRLAMIYVIVFVILIGLTLLGSISIIVVPTFEMVYQLMFPIFFLGSLAFMVSTVVKNGNGAAVVMVTIGMFFWIMADPLENSKWNLFLNPFDMPDEMSEIVWADVIINNRIYLLVGTAFVMLMGLFNLQKREKFV